MAFAGFQSKFKQNAKLNNCAEFDKDHISVNFSPQGEHVALIHEALNRWLINNGHGEMMINGDERDAKKFGKKTHDAVDFFKREKKILNFANQIDQVVGKKTVVALDKELPKEEDEKPKPETKVAVFAWSESKPLLIAHEADNRNKPDLDTAARPPVFGTGRRADLGRSMYNKMRGLPLFALETEFRTELRAGGEAGALMANTFIKNPTAKAVFLFQEKDLLPQLMLKSPEFAKAKSDFVAEMKNVLDTEVRISNTLNYRLLSFKDFNRLSPPLVSFGIDTSRQLKFSVGSTQGVDVFLTDFKGNPDTRKWNASLRFEYYDHFGSDDSDMIPDRSLHGSPGQVALWIMQHERHPGHMPFVSKMIVTAEVSESF